MSLTLGQALRNAIDAERAAASFYARLAQQTRDPAAQAFFKEMAAQELAHAGQIENLAQALTQGQLPEHSERAMSLVETAPDWEGVRDLGEQEALQLALEAEEHAANYYGAMAEASQGQAASVLAELARAEQGHARKLRERLR